RSRGLVSDQRWRRKAVYAIDERLAASPDLGLRQLSDAVGFVGTARNVRVDLPRKMARRRETMQGSTLVRNAIVCEYLVGLGGRYCRPAIGASRFCRKTAHRPNSTLDRRSKQGSV